MDQRTRGAFNWLVVMALAAFACAPVSLAPLPTPVPGMVNTIVVQTADAAATQTAQFQPPPSATPTGTPAPTGTPTETPTSTPTFVFVLSTPTKTRTATPIGGSGSGSSGKQYSCVLLAQDPPNGASIKAGKDFEATWQVLNNGTNRWDENNMDFVYLSGAHIYKHKIYDLPRNVNPGSTVMLRAAMQLPSQPDTYRITWGLKIGNVTFCRLTLEVNAVP